MCVEGTCCELWSCNNIYIYIYIYKSVNPLLGIDRMDIETGDAVVDDSTYQIC
jgi:hypothetical protein